MKTKTMLAALALAAVMMAMPAGAEAGFYRHGWCKPDRLFSWFRRDCICKKAVVVRKYRARKVRPMK